MTRQEKIDAAREEYERVTQSAWEEYERVVQRAREEYERVMREATDDAETIDHYRRAGNWLSHQWAQDVGHAVPGLEDAWKATEEQP